MFLEGIVARFAGPDADRLIDGADEDLAVTDTTGAGFALNRFDQFFNLVIGNHQLDLDLGDEVDLVLGTAVEFGVPFLPAETTNLADGHTVDAEIADRRLDVVKLERLDNTFYFFHPEVSFGIRGKCVRITNLNILLALLVPIFKLLECKRYFSVAWGCALFLGSSILRCSRAGHQIV